MNTVTKLLLDYPLGGWFVAFVVAGCGYFFTYEWLANVVKIVTPGIPPTAFSLLGFIVTSLSILTTVAGQGRVKTLTKNLTVWTGLVNTFVAASKYLACLGLLALFVDVRTLDFADPLGRIYTFTVSVLFVANFLELLKVIYTLESISILAGQDSK